MQYVIASNKWLPPKEIPDATARPMFMKKGNDIYLVNNAPYTRSELTIWKVVIQESKYIMLEPISVARLSAAATYFAFCVYNNNVYMCAAADGIKRVIVSVIPIETITHAQVNAKLMSLI